MLILLQHFTKILPFQKLRFKGFLCTAFVIHTLYEKSTAAPNIVNVKITMGSDERSIYYDFYT